MSITRNLMLGLAAAPLLSACVGGSKPPPVSAPVRQPAPTATRVPPTNPAPPSRGFIPPQIMRGPGLEDVSGASATKLLNLFGPPALDVPEGDTRKLQFRGTQCVLDVYLYPLRPGGEPNATWIEARRPDTGTDVDRATCIAALRR